jgi:hypothetical protein
MGRIRLQEARAVCSLEGLGPEDFDALFSKAADRFSLRETSDFLITEYTHLETQIEGMQPPGFDGGVRWLLLENVLRFLPLQADDSWAFESDAQRAQVTLSDALFERHWRRWFSDQTAYQATVNGLALRRILGLGESVSQGSESFRWQCLAKQLTLVDSSERDTSQFSAKLIGSLDRLFELVREDSESCALFVSCPIEWINLHSTTNIFDLDPELAELAQGLHEKYADTAFEPSVALAEDLREYEAILLSRAPQSFPSVWRPALISQYVRFSHKMRFGSVSPGEVLAAVRALDTPDDRLSAELLAFLFGVGLGANRTHSLERAIEPGKFEQIITSDAGAIPSHARAQTKSE